MGVLIIWRSASLLQAASRAVRHFGGGADQAALHREIRHTAV